MFEVFQEMSKRPTAAVILGAGRGTRLENIASPFAKTILDVNGLPVIGYAARAVEPFVDRIILVAHPTTANDVYKAISQSLRNPNREIEVALQTDPKGMADAMRVGFSALEEDFTVVVLAGDNIILDDRNIKNTFHLVSHMDKKDQPSKLAWTFRELWPDEARRFSVYRDLGGGTGELIEKPKDPPSKICWCGPVAFQSSQEALDRIKGLTPSQRGEYEATDLMNTFIMAGESTHIELLGEWFDVGTPESLEAARRCIRNS